MENPEEGQGFLEGWRLRKKKKKTYIFRHLFKSPSRSLSLESKHLTSTIRLNTSILSWVSCCELSSDFKKKLTPDLEQISLILADKEVFSLNEQINLILHVLGLSAHLSRATATTVDLLR